MVRFRLCLFQREFSRFKSVTYLLDPAASDIRLQPNLAISARRGMSAHAAIEAAFRDGTHPLSLNAAKRLKSGHLHGPGHWLVRTARASST